LTARQTIVKGGQGSMGRRLRKRELLAEIQRERVELEAALALLTRRQMTKAGVDAE
jgi:hypothetical protein